MNNTYYFARMVDYIGDGDGFSNCDFIGIFATRKNAEDAVSDILSSLYGDIIPHTDYSAEANFLDEYSDRYRIDKIEVNKNYY